MLPFTLAGTVMILDGVYFGRPEIDSLATVGTVNLDASTSSPCRTALASSGSALLPGLLIALPAAICIGASFQF
jgi:hypothetical protein